MISLVERLRFMLVGSGFGAQEVFIPYHIFFDALRSWCRKGLRRSRFSPRRRTVHGQLAVLPLEFFRNFFGSCFVDMAVGIQPPVYYLQGKDYVAVRTYSDDNKGFCWLFLLFPNRASAITDIPFRAGFSIDEQGSVWQGDNFLACKPQDPEWPWALFDKAEIEARLGLR